MNERLETTAEGVFAAGDCAGSPHFTNIAFDDFRFIREAMAGRLVPSCLFVDPEHALIGLDETEAKLRKIPYRPLKLAMGAVLRTCTTGETTAPVQLAIGAGLPYTALRDSTFTNPTRAEGLVDLPSSTPVRAPLQASAA